MDFVLLERDTSWVEMERMVEEKNCNARKSLGFGPFIACHAIFVDCSDSDLCQKCPNLPPHHPKTLVTYDNLPQIPQVSQKIFVDKLRQVHL